MGFGEFCFWKQKLGDGIWIQRNRSDPLLLLFRVDYRSEQASEKNCAQYLVSPKVTMINCWKYKKLLLHPCCSFWALLARNQRRGNLRSNRCGSTYRMTSLVLEGVDSKFVASTIDETSRRFAMYGECAWTVVICHQHMINLTSYVTKVSVLYQLSQIDMCCTRTLYGSVNWHDTRNLYDISPHHWEKNSRARECMDSAASIVENDVRNVSHTSMNTEFRMSDFGTLKYNLGLIHSFRSVLEGWNIVCISRELWSSSLVLSAHVPKLFEAQILPWKYAWYPLSKYNTNSLAERQVALLPQTHYACDVYHMLKHMPLHSFPTFVPMWLGCILTQVSL